VDSKAEREEIQPQLLHELTEGPRAHLVALSKLDRVDHRVKARRGIWQENHFIRLGFHLCCQLSQGPHDLRAGASKQASPRGLREPPPPLPLSLSSTKTAERARAHQREELAVNETERLPSTVQPPEIAAFHCHAQGGPWEAVG